MVVCLLAAAAHGQLFYETRLYDRGDFGYAVWRIPAVVVSNAGTLLAFAEGRVNSAADTGNIDLVLRRSFDNGLTWSSPQVVYDDGGNTIGNPVPIVDRVTGTIWLLFCRNNAEVFVTQSTDDGLSWSAPVNITNDVADSSWPFVATGPVHGFQTATGRLVAPSYRNNTGSASTVRSYMIYSDDHGNTWQAGGFPGARSGEPSAVETEDGRILLNARSWDGNNQRAVAFSSDGGDTWGPLSYDVRLPDPPCQGAVIRYTDKFSADRNRLLMSNPASFDREKLSVRVSYDEGLTWTHGRLVSAIDAGYSDLVILPNGAIGVFYERGQTVSTEEMWFSVFDRAWLEAVPDHVLWRFDEQASGVAALTPGSIEDASGFGLDAAGAGTRPPGYVPGAAAYGPSSALNFKDSNDRVVWSDLGNRQLDFDAGDSFTIEAVIRTTQHASGGSSGAGALVAKDWDVDRPSWWLRIEDGVARFLIDDAPAGFSSVASSVSVTDGEWRHVAAVRDVVRDELRIYVDHQLAGVATDTTTGSLANDRDIVIGAFNSGGREFVGDIDFVRISRGALDPAAFVQPAVGGKVVAHWTFEDGAPGASATQAFGALTDVSGNRRPLSTVGVTPPTYAAGAASFTQTSSLALTSGADAVVFEDRGGSDFDFGADESFTLEVVFRTTAHGGNGSVGSGALVSKDWGPELPSWWLRVENGAARFLIDDDPPGASAVTSGVMVNDGAWRHVAAVRDAMRDELRLYVDHALVGTAPDTTTGSLANDEDLLIGAFGNASREFEGEIDLVRIARGALKVDEFVQRTPFVSTVLADWRFDDGPAGAYPPTPLGKILDSSGRDHHLSVQGTPRPVRAVGDPVRGGTPALLFRAWQPDALVHVDSGDARFDFGAADSFTLEAIIKTSGQEVGGLVAKDSPIDGAGWVWRLDGNGTMRFSVSDGLAANSVRSSVSDGVADGQWRHVAAVRDAGSRELRLYVDYALVKTSPDITSDSLANDKDLLLGAIHSADSGFDGLMDRVRITAAALEPGAFLPCGVGGDLTCDGVRDVLDLDQWSACVNGPEVLVEPAGCERISFLRADLDGDGDVDVADAAALLQTLDDDG